MQAALLPLRKGAASLRPPVSAAAATTRPGLCLRASAASPPAAHFSTSPARPARNQILSPIRNPDSFTTHLALSSSSRTPLLTLWTASWCPTCHTTVLPLLSDLVASGVGEAHGGVALAAVEMDAPDLMGSASSSYENLALTYMITTVPTLLSFDAGEAQVVSKVTDARKLADRRFLEQWIINEAKRQGSRGGGGGGGAGGVGASTAIFGGLFGHG